MTKGYLFISNSTKPTHERASQRTYKLNTFDLAPMTAAKAMGYTLFEGVNRNNAEEVRCENMDVVFYDQHCYRSMFAIKDNLIAYRNLDKFLQAHPEIEVIHCNTPIGGFMGRVVGHKHGIKKIIYTVHGFHFFKGAPLFNRLILKWIEKILARWTDVIITINNEDFESANKFSMKKGGKVFKVHGVGVYTQEYNACGINRVEVRKSLGIPNDAFLCIGMGDIIPRKNYKSAIEGISLSNNPRVHYIICGVGPQVEELESYAKDLSIESQIHFLGFRHDIKELALASDLFLFSSLQEGLPRSTMEAMCAGLPCVVSNIRGNKDLIDNGKGGYLVSPTDSLGYAEAINRMCNELDASKRMGEYNKEKIKEYDIDVVKKEILDIYQEVL